MADEIAQATISLTLTIKRFGHKINNNFLINWAKTLEKNWPKKLPRNFTTGLPIIITPEKSMDKLTEEFEPFLKIEEKALNFILNKEIKIFLKFFDKRSLYDIITTTFRQ